MIPQLTLILMQSVVRLYREDISDFKLKYSEGPTVPYAQDTALVLRVRVGGRKAECIEYPASGSSYHMGVARQRVFVRMVEELAGLAVDAGVIPEYSAECNVQMAERQIWEMI